MSEPLRNWAGNYTYAAARVHTPETVEQVQELARGLRHMRALGSRHSFNGIADTDADMVSLARLNRVLAIDAERRTVTVEGGITYGQLGPQLHQAGYALHNLASLPHISVAGAVATATHGSGVANGNLATAVAGMELVTADGELVSLTREHPDFLGAVVGLGGLGIVTQLTLDILPSFAVRQQVYEQLPLAQVEQHFEAITSSAYSVSLFTDWRAAAISQVWLKRLATDPAEAAPSFFGATPAPADRHPIAALSAEPCTPQLGVAGPWHERLPHFRMEFTPSSGAELQTEYYVPRQHAVAALRAISELRAQIAPLLMISEIRTIAADQLWMSPCYQQDCVAFHFTWQPDWPAVQRVLPLIEAGLGPLAARPHWGKLFTMDLAQVQAGYPRLADFRRLLQRYDPQGKLRNPFLDRYVCG